MQDILERRRKEGSYKEDKRDFIDMFIKEIDQHAKLNSLPNHYTGLTSIINHQLLYLWHANANLLPL